MNTPAPHPLRSRPAAAMAWLLALAALPYALPERLATLPLPAGRSLSLRLLSPPAAAPAAPLSPADEAPPPVGSVALLEGPEPEAPGPEAPAAAPFAPGAAASGEPAKISQEGTFLDPGGRSLLSLFGRLRQVGAGEPGARARVLFYGDSIVAFDQVTDTLRRRLIDRFGDAGRGFVLPVSPWSGYYQSDVARFSGSRWMASRVVGPTAPDNRYGLGGVSFVSSGEAMALLATSQRGSYCKTASRFVVSYAAQPGGGDLRLQIDGGPPTTIATQAPLLEDRFAEVSAPDGPHQLSIRTEGGPVRMYGVELLRDAPGVTLDALGIIGARIRHIEQLDEPSWAAQIARRDPALVVLGFGINDVSDGVRAAKIFDEYEPIAGRVIERVQRHAPGASCLIMGPLDRGSGGSDPYTSKGIAGRVNATLKRVALAHGCAYFDVFTLMGGAGGMVDWVNRGLGSSDFMHPSQRGAALLGNLLADELLRRYDAWLASPAARR